MGNTFANWYDFFMRPLERRKFKEIRKELLQNATGKVLEIGSGTGINFPLYQHASHVVAIEPSTQMIMQSEKRRKQAVVPIEIVQSGAERLPFEDHSFDTIVATLVFCTIPDVEDAIHEIKRVCKPNGKIILFEHVKMENRLLSQLQEWLTPAWKKICDGCCLNRQTLHTFQHHGFEINKLQKIYKDLFIVAELKIKS